MGRWPLKMTRSKQESTAAIKLVNLMTKRDSVFMASSWGLGPQQTPLGQEDAVFAYPVWLRLCRVRLLASQQWNNGMLYTCAVVRSVRHHFLGPRSHEAFVAGTEVIRVSIHSLWNAFSYRLLQCKSGSRLVSKFA